MNQQTALAYFVTAQAIGLEVAWSLAGRPLVMYLGLGRLEKQSRELPAEY
jgi:hypothetical protein